MKHGLSIVFVTVGTLASVFSTQGQIVEGPALVPFNRPSSYRRNPAPDDVRKAQDSAYFIQTVFSQNKVEILKCDLASSRASTDLIRALARTTARHHKEMNSEVRSLAGKRYTIVSKQLSPEQKEKISELSALTGPEFDKAFLADQTDTETKMIALYEQTAADERDDTVKRFAENSLPTLRKELQMAQGTSEASGLTVLNAINEPVNR